MKIFSAFALIIGAGALVLGAVLAAKVVIDSFYGETYFTKYFTKQEDDFASTYTGRNATDVSKPGTGSIAIRGWPQTRVIKGGTTENPNPNQPQHEETPR